MKLFIPRFCPAKRQSTGRFVISGSFVRLNANPPDKLPLPNITLAAHHLKTTKKASQVRYNLTRFAGSWLRGYQSCKLPPEIVAYISKYK
jgi:hypothetical protein